MKFYKLTISLLPLFIVGCILIYSEPSMIERVENGLLPPVVIKGEPPFTLSERMEYYKVPGVSIVVIRDFKIDWVKNYGVIDIDKQEPVTDKTLFGAGSISKSLTAMAVLKKAEEGKLQLDGDINDQLITWKLPENEHTKKAKVTVRQLLNHSGGVSYSPSYGYTLGDIPTLYQILEGEEPAKSRPVRVDKEPGTGFQYSNAGYIILQQLIMDIEKNSFPEIMKETVFKPLGMSSSTFEQPLSPEWVQYAASGHRHDGMPIDGKRLIYPHMAAVGVWTTATDIAKFLIELQLSVKNKSNKVLTAEMVEQMLNSYVAVNYGLGVFLSNYGGESYFSHEGDVWGFNCVFISHKTKGYGAVVMANSANGRMLNREIIRGIADVYEWEGFVSEEYEIVNTDAGLLEQYTGRYLIGSDRVLTVTKEDDKLFMKTSYTDKIRLFQISQDKFALKDQNEILTFVRDSTGTVTDVARQLASREYTSKRISEDYKVPFELLMEGEIEEAVSGYRKLKNINPYDYYVSEVSLNILGYYFLRGEKYDEAIAIFKLNCELYPLSFNVYDSLGEAYMSSGDKELSIRNYEKSLEINPGNTNAVERLKKLRVN